MSSSSALLHDFYPRPPRGGRLNPTNLAAFADRISIHALREEGDAFDLRDAVNGFVFLSTPSARRATPNCGWKVWLQSDFYPRPPRGGRPTTLCFWAGCALFLSTPSARRATTPGLLVPVLEVFLSTPSARRATPAAVEARDCRIFSIHALREEGDINGKSAAGPPIFFFLSTPSARRATAKTETKSLFSNKLYNILHEFRRALIYSGSKNYPNHAKRLKNLVRRCRKDAENSPFAPGRETQNNSRPSCSKGG